jgi:hypothetical protein
VAGIDLSDFLPSQPTQPTGTQGWQALVDYGSSPTLVTGTLVDCPVYVGIALSGTKQTDPTWVIRHLTYDATWRLTSKTLATGAWTNRASLTYS